MSRLCTSLESLRTQSGTEEKLVLEKKINELEGTLAQAACNKSALQVLCSKLRFKKVE